MLRNDTPEFKEYRGRLAVLDQKLHDAFRYVGIDPDWKAKEAQLLSAALDSQKKGKP